MIYARKSVQRKYVRKKLQRKISKKGQLPLYNIKVGVYAPTFLPIWLRYLKIMPKYLREMFINKKGT